MAKLYIFGIGGTGSRVLRSLTMLLASGVDSKGYEVVPLVIDPDMANADLTRAVELMGKYCRIHGQLTFADKGRNTFFRTPMTQTAPGFTIAVQDTSNKTFDQFIDLAGMSRSDQAMAEMLFSQKNLGSTMNVGFKGNPNIGSVVLNQLAGAPEIIAFANSFTPGDRIFIISSIFGGTGASGFPLLLKTLRQNKTLPNAAAINAAQIGALSVLPYFSLKADDGSEIDSSTFFAKTRAALRYYQDNVAAANALYYIGDMPKQQHDNCEGGAGQHNDANMIELLAATAIIDFCHGQFPTGTTSYRELGLDTAGGAATLRALPAGPMRQLYARPLIALALAAKSLVDDFGYVGSQKLKANHSFDEHIYESQFMTDVRRFLSDYKDWLAELAAGKPSFAPFNMEGTLETLVSGAKAKAGLFHKLNDNYFRSELDRVKTASGASESDRLMETYCTAATKLATDNYTL